MKSSEIYVFSGPGHFIGAARPSIFVEVEGAGGGCGGGGGPLSSDSLVSVEVRGCGPADGKCRLISHDDDEVRS
jgi:hypothetical protein